MQTADTNDKNNSYSRVTVLTPDEQTKEIVKNITSANSTTVLSFGNDTISDDKMDQLVNETVSNVGKFYL